VALAVIVSVGVRIQRQDWAEPVRPLGETYGDVAIVAPKAADLAGQPATHTDAA
jgi:hypothetical protein